MKMHSVVVKTKLTVHQTHIFICTFCHYRSADDRLPAEERFKDEDDGVIDRRHIPLSRRNRKHIPHWYARRIEKLSKQGMVRR